MKEKIAQLVEEIFSRLFDIVAYKNYLVSFQWDQRGKSHFFQLGKGIKYTILSVLLAGIIGLVLTTMELAMWSHHTLTMEYHQKQNYSLKQELLGVLSNQSNLEISLDSLNTIEDKIRALYGMQSLDKGVKAFGIGGRRNTYNIFNPYQDPIFEQVQKAAFKAKHLEKKLTFSEGNLKQIQDFVKYKHHLWEHTPSVIPAKGRRSSGFGYRLHPVTGRHALHEGIDISNHQWTPIHTSASGIVLISQKSGNYGNLVVVDHGNGYTTKYGHLSKILVEKGQLVKRYELIGYMGKTGRTTGTHLHYEVHRDGSPQNPEKYILPPGVVVD